MFDEVCECEQEWRPGFIHFIRESFLPAGRYVKFSLYKGDTDGYFTGNVM